MSDPQRKCLAVFAMVFLLRTSSAAADTVHTADGRVWKGIIVGQTARDLKLDLGFDLASIEKETIVRVERSGPAETERLRTELDAKRLRRDRILGARDGGPKEAPLINVGGHVLVDAVLNGRASARLFLDTGSTATILSPETARRAGLVTKGPARSVKLVTSDGRQSEASLYRLDTLAVGGAQVRDVDVVILSQKDGNALYGDGLLGVSYLSRFDFKIDYRRGVLVLDPNGRAGSYAVGFEGAPPR